MRADAAVAGRNDVLLDLVGETYALLDLETFQPGLLQALGRAMPVDWASLNSLAPEKGEVVAISEPPVTPPELYEVYAQHAHEHPIVGHFLSTNDGRPIRISDLVDQPTLHSFGLYQGVYAVIGIEYQVAFTLPSPAGHVLGVALSRGAEDFSDDEVSLLRRARPHLIQAYRNALDHTELKRRLAVSPVLPRADLGAYGLTGREVEVVRRVASGRRNGDIAEELGVSDRTVQKHLQRAYRKLGVSSRSDAARIAWRLDADRERAGSHPRSPYAGPPQP